MGSVTAVILTFNESVHIKRCIDSLEGVVDRICICDSYSTDDTVELAKSAGAEILHNTWINYAKQFNWALDNFDIKTKWIMRMDADEYLDQELRESLKSLSLSSDTNAIYFNRYISFMGRVLSWGGMADYWMLRMWCNGQGRCEKTWMDEHIIVENECSMKLPGKLVDDNLNHLSWWSIKHVHYSTREAIDVLVRESALEKESLQGGFSSGAGVRRMLKGMYNRLPLFTRPFLYFLYRFMLRAGFMDGTRGVIWCVLQGFWYRFLVDAKVYEIKAYAKRNDIDVFEATKRLYGYEVRSN